MPYPLDDLLDRARLVLAQDDFRQLVVFGQKDDVVVQHLEEPPVVEEGLDCFFITPPNAVTLSAANRRFDKLSARR